MKASVMFNLIIVLILAFAWLVVVLLPHGWHEKLTLLYGFDMGLYKAEIRKGPINSLTSMAMRNTMGKLSPGTAEVLENLVVGTYHVGQLREYMCGLQGIALLSSVTGDICHLFTAFEVASLIMIFMATAGIVCLLTGAVFQYKYWAEKSRRSVRVYQRGFYMAAPIVFFLAMAQYTYLTSFLSQFPPAGSSSFSYAYGFAAVLSICSLLPIFISESVVGEALDENINEQLSIQKHFVRDQMAENEISSMETAYTAQVQAGEQGYGTMQGIPQGYPTYTAEYGQGYPPTDMPGYTVGGRPGSDPYQQVPYQQEASQYQQVPYQQEGSQYQQVPYQQVGFQY